jgi:DNA-binding GntR family transcriptional regulator
MSMTQTPTPRLGEAVYDRIRDAIVAGRFRPNQRLVETEIAEEMEISRTPVRESLQRLASEGLVRGGRHGWVVHEHTLDEIREIYETRSALEGYAARLAAERLSDEDVERIAAIHDEADPAMSREELVEVNARFHDAILDGCGNRRLLDLIARNREFYFNRRLALNYTGGHVHESLTGHERILDALRRRDGDAAEEQTRQHILDALQVIYLQQH